MYNFLICAHVQGQIDQYQLNDEDRIIVNRCVGGYGVPQGLRDRIEKSRYRWEQYLNSYPDWKRSIELLDTRKVELYQSTSSNGSATIIGNIFLAPFKWVDYHLQDSGTDNLNKLIQSNLNT